MVNFKSDRIHSCLFAWCLVFVVSLVAADIRAQDAVYKYREGGGNSKVSGKIESITPDGVTVDGDQIPASQIKKLVFRNEPSEISRARDQMDAGRFSDCLEELKKIKESNISRKIQQEIDFLNAYSTAQISLRGGSIAPVNAGKVVGQFLKDHSNSCHLYPALEQYGKLLWAFGKPDLAANEFAKLTNSTWPEYVLKGHFYRGQILSELGQHGEAVKAFDAILATESNDDTTQSYQLLAKCEKARAVGLAGDPNAARNTIEGIIRDESPENKRLFAYLYNALGAVFEKSGQMKEAARAYLHTELLFATEPEPHAEALYRLALIWPKLEETDRANRARDTLKSRYRNSYWAGKL